MFTVVNGNSTDEENSFSATGGTEAMFSGSRLLDSECVTVAWFGGSFKLAK